MTKFNNRQMFAALEAQDAARRQALVQRLSGKPAPKETVQDLIVKLQAALAAKESDNSENSSD